MDAQVAHESEPVLTSTEPEPERPHKSGGSSDRTRQGKSGTYRCKVTE